MSGSPASLEEALRAFGLRHPESRLSLARSAAPPGLVIMVDGPLDTQNSGDFQTVLNLALETAKETGALILDLAGLNYVSSTGVGTLTQALVEARRHQLPFYLCRVSNQARSILDVLGFTSFFPMIDGCAEAR